VSCRAASIALDHADAQRLLIPDAPPTKADRDLANAFEAHVERVAALLRSGIQENQIVPVRKTSPHRAGTLADLLALSRHDPHPDGDRWDTLCQAGTVLLFIVHTWPDGDHTLTGRIISARKATRQERKAYEDGEYQEADDRGTGRP